MSKYLVRRLLIALPVLFGISLVLFTILALAPGDPFEELATNPNVPASVRMNLRVQYGLDDPLPVRYARWFSSMLRGDWGFSFVSRVNVDELILQRLPVSLFVLDKHHRDARVPRFGRQRVDAGHNVLDIKDRPLAFA